MKTAVGYARNSLVWILGFALGAAVLSAVVLPVRVAHLSVKLEWLKAHPGDFEIVVIGSSRMRQIVPAVFDAACRRGDQRKDV